MLLRNLQNSPEKRLPIAMMFVSVGMMLIVLGITWHRPLAPAHSGTDWSDFLRGFLLGLAIVFEIFGLVLAVTAARANKAKETDPAPQP